MFRSKIILECCAADATKFGGISKLREMRCGVLKVSDAVLGQAGPLFSIRIFGKDLVRLLSLHADYHAADGVAFSNNHVER
jgi:hypothetical protein